VLKVPSAIVTEEWNYLLNPLFRVRAPGSEELRTLSRREISQLLDKCGVGGSVMMLTVKQNVRFST
jgi:hypothetical protein